MNITTTNNKTKKIISSIILSMSLITPGIAGEDVLGDFISIPDSEVTCLARAIYHEARGESEKGKQGVAKVVINRQKHPYFHNTICQVIKAAGQFPWAKKDFTRYQSADFLKAKGMAKNLLAKEVSGEQWGPDISQKALFFNTVPFKYSRLKYTGKIGGHLFYGLKDI